MKRLAIVLLTVALLAVGFTAYAQRGGGPGVGPRAASQQVTDEEFLKFLDETYTLRKDMHNKMFDLMEAERKGDDAKAEALETEIDKLRDQIAKKAPQGMGRKIRRGGMMGGMGYGGGCGMMGGYGGGYGCGGGCGMGSGQRGGMMGGPGAQQR